MGEVYQFKVKDDAGVAETLENALSYGFDEVVVIGIKGDRVHSSKSANSSTITWLGMLAYLQQYLYNRMSGIE